MERVECVCDARAGALRHRMLSRSWRLGPYASLECTIASVPCRLFPWLQPFVATFLYYFLLRALALEAAGAPSALVTAFRLPAGVDYLRTLASLDRFLL